MQNIISKIFPRAIDCNLKEESATFIHSLFSLIHLDRRHARDLGWRGIKPSFTENPAWSAQLAGINVYFGLVFREEELFENEILSGVFDLFIFPTKDYKFFENLCDKEKIEVTNKDFPKKIRELSSFASSFSNYKVAEIELLLRLDASAVALTLTAYRQKENRYPLKESMPFFSILSSSLLDELETDKKELILWGEKDSHDPSLLVSISACAGEFVGKLPGKRMIKNYFAPKALNSDLTIKPIVHVLSGFLGSGKTTFLRHWLDYLNNRERFTGVIQNEFGEVDLDSLILSGETKVEAIDAGCVCCTLADSLRPAIERLIQSTAAQQFVIETTGLAKASFVMDSLLVLNDLVTQGLLITVVDVFEIANNLNLLDFTTYSEESFIRKDQIINADCIVCSKSDKVSEAILEKIQAKLHEINPGALIIAANCGCIPFGMLDAYFLHKIDKQERFTSRLSPSNTQDFHFGIRKEKDNSKEFSQKVLSISKAITFSEIEKIIKNSGVVSRAKGILKVKDTGAAVVQFASGILNIETLPQNEKTREVERTNNYFLVLIGKNLEGT